MKRCGCGHDNRELNGVSELDGYKGVYVGTCQKCKSYLIFIKIDGEAQSLTSDEFKSRKINKDRSTKEKK